MSRHPHAVIAFGMKVWLIDVGLHGHKVQVETVGKILARKAGAECAWIRGSLSVRGGARSLLKRFIGVIPKRWIPGWIRLMYHGFTLPEGLPDLIVTSGSGTIPLCRLLKRLSGAPSIFLGEIHPPRSTCFDLVVATVTLGLPNEIITPLTLTGYTPELAAQAAAGLWPEGVPEHCWTMIIGGNGKFHEYDAGDWRTLAESMNQAAARHGIRWLISTSRRTGAENEAILKDGLAPGVIADAIWWASSPRQGLAAFVYAGERVFVTRDSLTMISEVIATRELVEVVCPGRDMMDTNSVFARYQARLKKEGRLSYHRMNELDDACPARPADSIRARQEAFEALLAARTMALVARRNRDS